MPPKKKLSKKEKARLEAEQAELLRIELEKEKLKKVEEQRMRKQIEREEAEKRQRLEIVENQERRQQLKASMLYFNDIRSQIVAIKQEVKQYIEWEKYMRCNGLPNANCPSDLRKYIHMWKEDIKSRHRNERNWLLKTDERTLLTQDTNIPNLSRSNLRQQQGNLGDLYAGRIKEVLGILAEVDEAVADETQSIGTVTDLCKLKTEIRDFLRDYLDEYTYKILSHIERDMEPDEDRPGISQHIYLSTVFKSQIWSISPDAQVNPKDQKLKTDESQHAEIDFPAIKVQITLPPSVAVTNCAFRSLWLNYDHFSDYCPTYHMLRQRKDQLNILLQTKKEWKKRKEILQSMLDEASQELPISDFDPTNMPDEPTTPRKIDIDKIYNDYEDELNRERRKLMVLSANELGEFEVNLRKYRIMGGVFAVDHLEQPQQDKRVNAHSFTRTITSPSMLVRKSFHQTYKPPPPPVPGVRRLPEEIEAEMRYVETNLEKLGSVTVELPNSVIWFEPPIACRWEILEETNQSENAEKKPSSSSLVAEKPYKTRNDLKKFSGRSASHSLNLPLPVRCITDFDMLDIPPGLDVYGLLEEFVVPRLPEGYCVQVDDSIKYTTPKVKLLYLARHKVDTDLQLEKNKFPAPITESLVDTGMPRALYPQFNFEKILQIKRPDKDDDSDDDAADKRTQSENGNSQECQEWAHDDGATTQDSSAAAAPIRYMFSQLLEDLDRLCELQMPSWNEHVQKICSNLSSPNHEEDDDEETAAGGQLSPEHSPTRKPSGIVIIQGFEVKANDDNEGGGGDEGVNDEFCETESTSEYEDNEDFLGRHQIVDAPDDNGQNDNHDNSLPSVGKWSTRDVHDTKFNEDKLAIQFRIGRLGIYGFAMNRYCNMPYQAWELKPDFRLEGAIQFSFTASIISLDMSITAGGYCMNSFQGGTTDAVNEMIGRTLSLAELQAILIQSGVDIFPDEDAFCYTEGSCEKNYVMEMHLYACMSTLGLSHNFGWSRWNLLAGSRTAVLLMRELVENKKPSSHSTLLVTPLRTAIIDSTEVSASFNPVPAQGMDFYADLYQLSQIHSSARSRHKQRTIDPVLRDNVARILMSIRPLSFC